MKWTVLAELLPIGVVVAERRGDDPDADTGLYPVERAQIARAVPVRRAEFATGRSCARRALVDLGRPPVAIPTGHLGAPQWPAGVVGSITHCRGYRAAAVADTSRIGVLGIDAEPHEPLPEGVLDVVARPEERAMIGRLRAGWPGLDWDRVLFSAKEAVYKAWAPRTGRFLEFDQAAVDVRPDAGTFRARVLVAGGGAIADPTGTVPGAFTIRDGLVLTVVCH